ncbi:MAG: SMC family ATPase [Thermoproteota archaeon]|nr:SMC family ATPase [Thermoproteota archaeon]
MIKAIELVNFISHSRTLLAFNRGVTIFVGHNGSGKSSIIDAITFALYGQHTRKTNKNLVRRGSEVSWLNLRFSVGSKEYNAYRRLGSNGQSQLAKFDQVLDSGNIVEKNVVSGERKQFGDSMSGEIAKTLGIDYKKLKVAAVVQQGELSSIIDSKPKEFKELLNSLIGIDRLDTAYQTMYEVVDRFRERLRDKNGGFDDKQIASIKSAIQSRNTDLQDAENQLKKLEAQRDLLKEQIFHTENDIQRMEPLILQSRELHSTEDALVKYVTGKRISMAKEVERLDGLVSETRESLKAISEKEEVEINLQMIKSEIEEMENKIVLNERENGRLNGVLECAKRIEIRDDGTCPLCGSPVQVEIQNIFDFNIIETEIRRKIEERKKLLTEKVGLKTEERIMEEKEKKIESAEMFLASTCVEGSKGILDLESELERGKSDLLRIPQFLIKISDPRELVIDDFSKSLVDNIINLRSQTKGLKMQDYTNSKLKKTKLSNELLNLNAKLGGIEVIIRECKNTIDTSNKILLALEDSVELLNNLEKIRSKVFNRDGPVALRLRSWVLKVLSAKASEYLSMFKIGISKIELTEKARDVQVTCYGIYGDIDMDSLSGGEKVAVALALRLAIAQMVSLNKLDFIILDEPTIHLDEERRKSLVNIISDFFKEGLGPLSQIIIITHDAEIFEDSDVDGVFRFTMGVNGSVVVPE